MTPRGCTGKPCEGCNTAGTRLVGQVCGDCERLLKEAKAARDVQAERISKDEVRVWRHHRDVPHWNPGYYEGEMGHDERDALRAAFTDVIDAISEPALGVPRAGAAENFLTKKSNTAYYEGTAYHGHDYVSALVRVRDALDALDGAIRQALKSTHNEAYAEGVNLLRQLGRGDLSLTKFDERREERE